MRTELQTDQADVRRITHQQVMAAALGVLETQGARSLVMRRLAEALDVSLPTLYVVIACLILAGIGIITGVSRTRSKDPS